MAAPTLQDLLTPRDQPTIEQSLLSSLQAATITGGAVNSFPVTDWAPGSFERTTLKMIAAGLADRENMIQMLTAAGYLDLAATITDADGNLVDGWLELLASQGYDIARAAATFAQQSLVLTCTSGPGPYTRNAGEIVAYSPSTGNRYSNIASVTIPNGSSVTATFQAQSSGIGYADAENSIIGLITPLPGVSVNNPMTVAGVPTSGLTGTGTIAVTSTGITTIPRTIALTFVVAGRLSDSTASFTCTVYEGNQITKTGPFIAATFSQFDVTMSLTDGPTSTQSFNLGDTWTVAVPGTPLIQAGSDEESLAQLTQECHDRWSSLSDVPTQGRIEGLVFACSRSLGLGLTKVRSMPSTDVAGIENVYIAGATATGTPAQVASTQAYLNTRISEIEGANVAAAVAHSVAPNGYVSCRRGTTSAVQTAADTAWAAYIAAMPIGGAPPLGLVEVAALIEILKDAGAYNVSSISFTGASPGADLTLAVNEIAVVASGSAGKPSLALIWQEVS